jgi:hypothetical protein
VSESQSVDENGRGKERRGSAARGQMDGEGKGKGAEAAAGAGVGLNTRGSTKRAKHENGECPGRLLAPITSARARGSCLVQTPAANCTIGDLLPLGPGTENGRKNALAPAV